MNCSTCRQRPVAGCEHGSMPQDEAAISRRIARLKELNASMPDHVARSLATDSVERPMCVNFQRHLIRSTDINRFRWFTDRFPVPPRLAEASLSSPWPGQEEAFAAARAWCDSDSPTLIIYGKAYGTGKSHIMAAVLNHLRDERYVPGVFVGMNRLLAMIRSSYGKNSEDSHSEAEFVEALREIPLVCIDDFGKGSGSEHEFRMTYDIVNARYENEMRTVFTTNLQSSEMFDDHRLAAAFDRMRDGAHILVIEGESLRRHSSATKIGAAK